MNSGPLLLIFTVCAYCTGGIGGGEGERVGRVGRELHVGRGRDKEVKSGAVAINMPQQSTNRSAFNFPSHNHRNV